MRSALTRLDCSDCGRRYGADELRNRCGCGGPLLARYDLGAVGVTPAEIAARPRGCGGGPSCCRYGTRRCG